MASGRVITHGSVMVAWDPNPEADIAGYKVYYGAATGDYPFVMDVGLTTEAEIPGLLNRQIYYCVVTAYNSAGLESGFSEELAVVYSTPDRTAPPDDPGLIILEPEIGIEADSSSVVKRSLQSPASFAPAPLAAQTAAPAFKTTIAFEAKAAGEYIAWFRVMAPAEGTATYRVSLDNGPESILEVTGGGVEPTWVWYRLDGPASGFFLTAGSHLLVLRSFDPGAGLDRIILSSNPNFVPTDALFRDGEVISIIRHPSGTSVKSGSPVILEIEAVSSGKLHYQWSRDGQLLPGETGPSITLSSADLDDAGSYQVHLWTQRAVIPSAQASLTVVSPEFQVSRMSAGANHSVTFEVDGMAGGFLEVHASSDLEEWTLIDTRTDIVSGVPFTVSDPEASGKSQRFYRMKIPLMEE